MPVHRASDASLHFSRCLGLFLRLPWWVRAPAVEGGTRIGSNLSLLGGLGVTSPAMPGSLSGKGLIWRYALT